MLFHVRGAGAQVNPSDMRSGSQNGAGDATLTLFTVPAGSTFVLTDFSWSPSLLPGDGPLVTLSLSTPPATFRWQWRSAYYNVEANTSFQLHPVEVHWTTGLVFTAGQAIDFRTGGFIAGRGWTANWSGYLATSEPGAIQEEILPAPAARLGQNAPNPFNPTTEIRYVVTSPGQTDLRIYDGQGRLARSLVGGYEEVGEHVVLWDGRNDAGERLPSGVYFYELRTPKGSESRKAVLVE
jgi:hypothetical protein